MSTLHSKADAAGLSLTLVCVLQLVTITDTVWSGCSFKCERWLYHPNGH